MHNNVVGSVSSTRRIRLDTFPRASREVVGSSWNSQGPPSRMLSGVERFTFGPVQPRFDIHHQWDT